jgi:hypothetical protein
MTTGLEVGAAIFGLIAGAIDITHKVIELYSAVKDKSGIPKSLRKVSEKLPSVEELLKVAEDQWKRRQLDKIDEETLRGVERDIEHCKGLCQKLHDLLLSTYPKAGSGKGERLLRGAKTVFSSKDETAEDLLGDIRDYLNLLTSRQILSNADALEELKSLFKGPPKGEGFTQQQCTLILDGDEDHRSVSAESTNILRSWILRSHGRTSTLVSSSTCLLLLL